MGYCRRSLVDVNIDLVKIWNPQWRKPHRPWRLSQAMYAVRPPIFGMELLRSALSYKHSGGSTVVLIDIHPPEPLHRLNSFALQMVQKMWKTLQSSHVPVHRVCKDWNAWLSDNPYAPPGLIKSPHTSRTRLLILTRL